MPSRKKSNLHLNRPKARNKLMKKKLRMHFELAMRSAKKLTPQNICTPRKGFGIGSLKRLSSRSPHSGMIKTPSKSPVLKKAKVSLLNKLESEAENNNLENTERCNFVEAKDGELYKFLPVVLEKLKAAGFYSLFIEFCRQVYDDHFPLNNIAFLLWMDVVKWFSCESTSFMRYPDDSKMFWKLGYKLFGGKFLNFMSGYKLKEENSVKGYYSPLKSELNFAFPDVKILRDFQAYNIPESETATTRKPGILKDMIHTVSKAMDGQPCCLTFDGKKLKQGLTDTSGDVDILGFEDGPSISDRRNDLDRKLQALNIMKEEISKYDKETNAKLLNEIEKEKLKECLKTAMQLMSLEVLNVKSIRKKKEYAKDKMIERSGETNWKNSKFAYGISSMIAFIHDIDVVTEMSMTSINEIISCTSYLNERKGVEGETVNLQNVESYMDLKSDHSESESLIPSRDVKQRTEAWYEARKAAKITGSSIFKAVGLDGLAKQKEHFDSVVCKLPEKEKSEDIQKALRYGTENEPNAMATLVCKVLPLLFPVGSVYEEGYIEIEKTSDGPFMIVSPDGSIRLSPDKSSTVAGIELKCPLMEIHKTIPNRYLLQCLSEIEALGVEELIYLCWRPDMSSVFRLKRNEHLFAEAYEFAKTLYDTRRSQPRRPTKVSEQSKKLKDQIQAEIETLTNIEFIGIVPSLRNDETSQGKEIEDSFKVSRVLMLLEEIINTLKKFFDLNREPASEAVAFLCCDLDRKWEESSIRSAPVCWFPKGYSLNTETMRKVLTNVLDECHTSALNIPAMSFDGQWHNICVKGQKGNPLTLLQLQKDLWRRVESMPKASILKDIKTINKCAKWQTIKNGNNQTVIEAYANTRTPMISASVASQRRVEQKRKTDANSAVQADDAIQVSENEIHIDQESAANEEMHEIEEQDVNDTHKLPNSQSYSFSQQDASTILSMLQTDAKCNTKGQWNEKRSEDILIILSNYEKMKVLRDIELKVIVRFLNKTKQTRRLKESSSKQEKLADLSQILGLSSGESRSVNSNKKKKIKMRRLDELAFTEISKTLILFMQNIFGQKNLRTGKETIHFL